MQILFDVFVLAAACALIMMTADLLVKGAVELSLALRLPKIFVAATIVSFLTTAAEFSVSFSSSLMGKPGIAVGSAVGSVICNVGLMFAIGAMVGEIKTAGTDIIVKSSIVIASVLIVLLLGLNGVIGYVGACLLLILLAIYLIYNYQLALKHRKKIEQDIVPEKGKPNAIRGMLALIFGGILTVVIARYGLIVPGVGIAKYFGVPDILIGLTLLAAGTSLPELFTVIASVRKGHGDIAVGNILGANTLNLLWVLGASALVRPLIIDRTTLIFNLPAAILFSLLMMLIGVRYGKFNRKSGLILLAGYIAYLLVLVSAMYR